LLMQIPKLFLNQFNDYRQMVCFECGLIVFSIFCLVYLMVS